MLTNNYRPGPVGALADLYAIELSHLKDLMSVIDEERFIKIINPDIPEDFRSIKNIMTHVVRSGYSYANHIRKRFNENYFIPTLRIDHRDQINVQLDQMFRYTLETLDNKWHLNDDDLGNTIIKTGWGVSDMEGLLEHAVMHIIRHRFQITKILNKI